MMYQSRTFLARGPAMRPLYTIGLLAPVGSSLKVPCPCVPLQPNLRTPWLTCASLPPFLEAYYKAY
jgi:hypothetical protein